MAVLVELVEERRAGQEVPMSIPLGAVAALKALEVLPTQAAVQQLEVWERVDRLTPQTPGEVAVVEVVITAEARAARLQITHRGTPLEAVADHLLRTPHLQQA